MNRARALLLAGAALLAAATTPRPAAAAWPTDPLVNLPLCTAAGIQWQPAAAPDGAGGAIVVWGDQRGGASFDVYAQRVSADGVIEWTADGVALCTADGDQQRPMVVADGTGGAIVSWDDYRSGGIADVYAQRVSAAGVVLWAADGVPLCTAANDQRFSAIAPDGAGGAIVAWQDGRSVLGVGFDIYAQRVSAAGTPQWAANGVALCTAIRDQAVPALVADGAGGAVAVWQDQRSGAGTGTLDIYAQRVSSGGVPQWTANGVALCTAAGDQSDPVVAPDGTGGAIAAWTDSRGSDSHVYAQRVSGGGAVPWAADGVALCTAGSGQGWAAIATDGAGGAIVAWTDVRGLTLRDIYAQRVSSAGAVQWTADGVALCTAADDQAFPTIAPDGSSGAVVTWLDFRVGQDVYAQRVSSTGKTQWGGNGVGVCTEGSNQTWPVIATDDEGGAIIAWPDARSGVSDVYAQRVSADGHLGGGAVDVPVEVPAALALEPSRPNPVRAGHLVVRFSLRDAAEARLELLDVAGRCLAVRQVGALGAGPHAVAIADGLRLPPGVYLVRLRQGAEARVTRVVALR